MFGGSFRPGWLSADFLLSSVSSESGFAQADAQSRVSVKITKRSNKTLIYQPYPIIAKGAQCVRSLTTKAYITPKNVAAAADARLRNASLSWY